MSTGDETGLHLIYYILHWGTLGTLQFVRGSTAFLTIPTGKYSHVRHPSASFLAQGLAF